MRFEKLLDLINIDKEFGGAENVEKKVKKFYDLLETTTALVFPKKKAFDDDMNLATKEKGNKIPKKIRQLMKRKKKVSGQVLSSKSWQKNFEKMEISTCKT